MIQIGEMTQLCCKNQDDNHDLLWILRDFDLKLMMQMDISKIK